MSKLRERLGREGFKSKVRTSRAGQKTGGKSFARGALYCLLQNPIYIGKIRHREGIYEGKHQAIIPVQLWNKVQERLKTNGVIRRTGRNAKSPSLLVGLLYDAQGNRFTPFHTDRHGKRYRYYVSQGAVQNGAKASSGPTRIPAREIEDIICGKLQSLLNSPEQLLEVTGARSAEAAVCKSLIAAGKQLAKTWPSNSLNEQREFLSNVIRRIVVHDTNLQITIGQSALRTALLGQPPTANGSSSQDVFTLTINAQLKRCGWEVRLVVPSGSGAEIIKRPSLPLIKAIARVHRWPGQIARGEFQGRHSTAGFAKTSQRYERCVLPLAFLAPDIVETILDGRQPVDLSVRKMLRRLPLSWMEQREILGFAKK